MFDKRTFKCSKEQKNGIEELISKLECGGVGGESVCGGVGELFRGGSLGKRKWVAIREMALEEEVEQRVQETALELLERTHESAELRAPRGDRDDARRRLREAQSGALHEAPDEREERERRGEQRAPALRRIRVRPGARGRGRRRRGGGEECSSEWLQMGQVGRRERRRGVCAGAGDGHGRPLEFGDTPELDGLEELADRRAQSLEHLRAAVPKRYQPEELERSCRQARCYVLLLLLLL